MKFESSLNIFLQVRAILNMHDFAKYFPSPSRISDTSVSSTMGCSYIFLLKLCDYHLFERGKREEEKSESERVRKMKRGR